MSEQDKRNIVEQLDDSERSGDIEFEVPTLGKARGGRKVSKLAAELDEKTKTLGQRAAVKPASDTPQRLVTMPGQLGAFRLEAKDWQDKVTALELALAASRAENTRLAAAAVSPGRAEYLIGDERYCSVVSTDKAVLVEFARAEDRAVFAGRLAQLLDDLAAGK